MDNTILTNPVLQAFLATLFTYGVTALGAGVVFFFKRVSPIALNVMLGFGAGVMIAASFWSLLSPAIDLCAELNYNELILPALGFVFGGLFVVGAGKFLDRYSDKFISDKANTESVKRCVLLICAVTLHNIPEGMAIGVAFGGAAIGIEGCSVIGASLLALGIGLQNFPEGVAVSLPLRREGVSRKKAFFFGQLSGLVEPISAIVGVLAAITIRCIQPFLLSFSAGAMIAVVSAELIPESARTHKNLCAIGVVIGFVLMMIMDVALG